MTIAAPSKSPTPYLSETDLEKFHRDGFVIARGLFGPEEVAAIRETFMTQAADGPVQGLSDTGTAFKPNDPLAKYPRMMNPHRSALSVGPISMKYILDTRLESILTALVGEPLLAAQSMFYFKPPGARGQDFHQDNFYLQVKPGTCIAAWIAVDDCDTDNGAMACVRETYDQELVCPEEADSSVSFTTHHVPIPAGKVAETAVMKAGDCLFFNGSTIHGSGPNTSATRFRRSLIFHYVPESCEELSHWYRPLLTFAGNTTERITVEGGGPCGTPTAAMGPH
jgi:phytanoyl-CoA hydroxylase